MSDVLLHQFIDTSLEGTEIQFLQYQVKNFSIASLDRIIRLQHVEAPMISRQSAHKRGKVVSCTYRPSLPPGKVSGTHFC